jgi:hypothetical protein
VEGDEPGLERRGALGDQLKDMTNSAWAAVFILLACVLACVALFSHSSNATSVITISSSIITGAFGYIQGKKDGENSLSVPMNPDSPASTITVTPPAPSTIPNAPK